MKEFNAVIGAVVAFLAALVAVGLWRAWVLTLLWGWLVVPLFHLPELRLIGAYTISLIAGFLTTSLASSSPTDEDRSWTYRIAKPFALGFILPTISLGVGWIAHFFV